MFVGRNQANHDGFNFFFKHTRKEKKENTAYVKSFKYLTCRSSHLLIQLGRQISPSRKHHTVETFANPI